MKDMSKSLFADNAYGEPVALDPQNADGFMALLEQPQVETASVSAIALAYISAREEVDAAKKVQSEAQKRLEQIEGSLIRKLDELGLKSVKLDGGGKGMDSLVTASEKTDYRLPSEDDQNALAKVLGWLRDNGGESLMKQSVAWQSFNGFVNECKKTGVAIPAEIKANTRRIVSVRKA